MEYSYNIRITHDYATAEALVLLFAERCQKMAVYEHTDQARIHIHIAIQDIEVGSKRLRQQAKETGLNLKGNKMASFKVWDKSERALVYMTKGIYNPKYLKGWTEDDAERWKRAWTGFPGQTTSPNVQLYDETFDDGEQDDIDYRYWTKDNPEFYTELYNDHPIMKVVENHKFQWVKEYTKKVVFQRNNRIWDMRALAQYRMLVFTYCYRHNLAMDGEWKKRF